MARFVHPRTRLRPAALAGLGALLAGAALAACGSSSGGAATASSTSPAHRSTSVTLVTYDSFALSRSTLAAFTKQTGIKVEVLKNGDTGKVVNTAILTKNRPEGDVLFGVDNTFLSKALDAGIFQPYTSPGLAQIDPKYLVDPTHRVTPVDHGEVCIDYDKTWFAKHGVEPPGSFEDLAEPRYKNLLVVENPATSAPGLSFLLATVAHFGPAGWNDYWKQLRANGVKVQPGWDNAYYTDYTAGATNGTRPIVVSYSTDPAAAVDYSDPKITVSPTAVLTSTCFATEEFAGVLTGAKHPDAARTLLDYLVGARVQADIPPNLYVLPVRTGTPLPASFVKYDPTITDPLTLDPATIGADRESWTRTWQATVLG